MPNEPTPREHPFDENAVVRKIVEGTAGETGERFFQALVRNLAEAMQVHAAWITEITPARDYLSSLAFWAGDHFVADYEYVIDGTPCEIAIDVPDITHYPDRIQELFPRDPDLKPMGVVSYIGFGLLDTDGTILGHLAAMDRAPMPRDSARENVFRIFAARAGAELRRLSAERHVREREQKMTLLLDSAMDAVVELDEERRVTRMNNAAEKMFACAESNMLNRPFDVFLSEECVQKLDNFMDELSTRPEGQRFAWIPEGLTATPAGGELFPMDATLSHYDLHGERYFTLILRNVNDRLEAEAKIRAMSTERDMLREEIEALQGFDEIIGRSSALRRVLEDVEQVAGTESTVLVTGETGTGKELIARSIHNRSNRSARQLIKVNCAAIPKDLVESEFFGHEKGAFTGATQKRDGRFKLAHKSTIFLDEVGELPLDLQAKLLRVLQEGEFDPVGSSQTQKVDVRVIAATNRDLEEMVAAGEFREDLYYRLNVFPLHVPALREREDDVLLLAEFFANGFAKQSARSVAPLSAQCKERLRAYPWPGNIRELQNVIERAFITAREGRLNLDRALPQGALPEADGTAAKHPETVRTAAQLREFERDNIRRALDACRWKISGKGGAAEMLGMNPSTLSSRMRALDIQRS